MMRLANKGKAWFDKVHFATLDLSDPYRRPLRACVRCRPGVI